MYAHVTIINKLLLLSFYNRQQYSKMNNCQLSLVSHNSFALFAYMKERERERERERLDYRYCFFKFYFPVNDHCDILQDFSSLNMFFREHTVKGEMFSASLGK